MPPRLRLFYSLLTAGLLLIPVVALYSELSKRSDIWWTPPPMAASLTESQDRVEIYVRGKPLGALLNEGKLRIAEETGSATVGASEISLRFNNWDRVRLTRLPILLFYAAACGAGGLLVLVIATGRLAYRGEKEPVPSAHQ